MLQGCAPNGAEEEAVVWQSSEDPTYINTAAIWDQVGLQEWGWRAITLVAATGTYYGFL